MAHPEWAVKYRRPGTELRLIKGRYCLYECRSVYDKTKKRSVKKTGKYLGCITEKDGFIESRKRKLERELEQARASAEPSAGEAPKVGEVKELGLSLFVSTELDWYVSLLKKHFPEDWQRLCAIAYCRLRFQSTMRRMSADFADSRLSVDMDVKGLSANMLSGFYYSFGHKRPQILAFLKDLGMEDANVIFDGTDFLSASGQMELPKMTKVKSGGFGTAFNVMFGYNMSASVANYYRLLPGNIKDVKAFALCVEEYGKGRFTAIIDKGFQSEENVLFLDAQQGFDYIMALKRNTAGLDYGVFASRDNSSADGFFMYHGRVIWYSLQRTYGDHRTFLYLDEKRRNEELTDYLAKVEDDEKENYTMETYAANALKFGTIALLASGQKDARQAYYDYKSRGEVEQCIDIFKNALEADTSYMHYRESLETWMFTNMIAMHWFCEIQKRLRDTKLISKHSPKDMIRNLCHLKSVYVDGQWRTAELTKKELATLKAFGLAIT